MNVLHLSTSDVGGAGKAAYRLHRNLAALGLNSKMMVLNCGTDDDNVIAFQGHRSVSKLKNIFTKCYFKFLTNSKYYFQSHNLSPIKNVSEIYNDLPFKPDVIVAHWVSNFITMENLYQLGSSAGIPIVWYLLDMAALTGGCHYAWECKMFLDHCGRCPALYSIKDHDLSYRNWKKKHDYIQRTNITIVPATDELRNLSEKSPIFKGKRIEQIMLGIDAEIFKPTIRKEARAHLDLPLDDKIIFFGAQFLNLKRKGMCYLIEALKILRHQFDIDKSNVTVITAGSITGIETFLSRNFHHRHLGVLTNDKMLAAAYQSADVFICPSIQDSGPMMINESVMCGTPVVSFNMGVASDLVITKKTGYCAQLKNSEDLAKGIKYILDLSPEQAENMSKQCSDLGLQYCHHRVQAEAFNRLFKNLLNADRK